jgi:putative ABC transport system substrate-binding protein
MNRREFITALTLPLWIGGARAQAQMRKVGFLGANTPTVAGHLADAFAKRLNELGWTDGKNITIEYRWAAGQASNYRSIAAEFVTARVDVIVTSGTASALVARQATSTIPIVMASSSDLLGLGLVESLARPGGNVTGLTFAPEDTGGKRLELLQTAVPGLRRVAILYNPDSVAAELATVKLAAPLLGIAVDEFEFRSPNDLDKIRAFTARSEIAGLYVISDPLVFVNRKAINEFALRERLPTVHRLQEYVEDGGMISYGPHFPDFFRRSADFVDKILKGTRPEDLPIERPSLYRLVVNLKTAKTLGLSIPSSLLTRADAR